MQNDSNSIRYFVAVGFALIVFSACFYGIVLYEFNLDDLKTGAFISLMTLAAQFVFAEAVGSSAGRRAQQSFQAGQRAANPPDNAGAAPLETTVPEAEPSPPPSPNG